LQEAVFRTWTHDLMVTGQQIYHCARAPLPSVTLYVPKLYSGAFYVSSTVVGIVKSVVIDISPNRREERVLQLE
jgi:hypothetical protein